MMRQGKWRGLPPPSARRHAIPGTIGVAGRFRSNYTYNPNINFKQGENDKVLTICRVRTARSVQSGSRSTSDLRHSRNARSSKIGKTAAACD